MAIRHKSEIKTLTSSRGVAAVLVMSLHSQNLIGDVAQKTGMNPAFGPAAYTGFFSAGYLWVDFFFILSGFVLYYVHGAEFRHGVRPGAYRAFMVKRVARVYPLNCFILVAYLGLEVLKFWWLGPLRAEPFGGRNTPLTFVTNFLMIQSWPFGTGAAWNTAAWSVSAEMVAYLLMPFMFLAFTAMRMRLVLASVAAGILGLALLMAAFPGKGLFLVNDMPWARCLCSIVMGIGLAVIYETRPASMVARILSSDLCIAAVAAAIVLCMHVRTNDLIVVALFLPLILGLALNQGWPKRVLCLRPIHWLGVVSYSVYLSHGLFLRAADMVGGHIFGPATGLGALLAFMAATLVAILAASSLLYRYVERPARRFGNRMWSANHPPILESMILRPVERPDAERDPPVHSVTHRLRG